MRALSWTLTSLSIAILLAPGAASAADTAAAATLSVLAPPVERVPVGALGPEPAANGIDLAEGDRVKTGPAGHALITFLDGSTVTVLPGSDVVVKQSGAGRGQSGIRLLITAGRVWARVVQAAGRQSGLTLESNEYAATARDGLIGAEQTSDGFACWSRRGDVRLTDRSGQTDVVVTAGKRAKARFGAAVSPEPFIPSASVLEVKTSGPVVPLVRMPNGQLAAGFLSPEVEVNQVFGSFSEGRGNRWLVEVPAGHEGPYTLVLAGTGTGAFTATVSSRYAGFAVGRREITGDIGPGERLYTRITQEVSGPDPRTARVREMRVEALQAWNSATPPAVVAEPPRAGRRVN